MNLPTNLAKPCSSLHQRATPSKTGSVLLITLLVVSLMMVVVISFVVFVRMELRTITNRQEWLMARSNAKLGALIALGRLQENLGPDMRISARSEILDAANPDHGIAAQNNMRFWTGAWTSEEWDPGDPTDRDNRFLQWLISMPEGEDSDAFSQSLVGSAIDFSDDEVFSTMANVFDATAGSDAEIRAGIRPIPMRDVSSGTTTRSGSYAWWVSDEGVKANIATSNPYQGISDPADVEDGTFDATLSPYLFPHRPVLDLTRWFGGLDLDKTYGDSLNSNIEKASGLFEPGFYVFDPASSDLISDVDIRTALADDNIFDDYTFFSKGIMTSTRRGGLRGDLSLAFWRNPDSLRSGDHLNWWAYPIPNAVYHEELRFRRIFGPKQYDTMTQVAPGDSVVGTLNPFGARWDLLRDFHNSLQKITVDDGYEVVRAWKRPGAAGPGIHWLPQRTRGKGESWQEISDPNGKNFNRWGIRAREVDEDPTYQGRYPLFRGNWPKNPGDGWELSPGDPRQDVEPTTSPIYPVMTRFIFHFEGTLVENPDQTAADISANGIKYRPEVRMKMYAVMWNPYNIPISLATNDGNRRGNRGNYRFPMQIFLYEQYLENYEIIIDDGTNTASLPVAKSSSSGTRNGASLTGDHDRLLGGNFANRMPIPIADVRNTDLGPGPASLWGGDPLEISDYEPGEVRVFSWGYKELDNVGNWDGSGGRHDLPGELTPFFTAIDDVGHQGFQDAFRKQLGLWSDPNSGYSAGEVVSFHFNVIDPSRTQGLTTLLMGYSGNSGQVQRPAQILTARTDHSVLPLPEPIIAGTIDPSTGDPIVIDLGYLEFTMKSGNDTHPRNYLDPLEYDPPRYAMFNPRGYAGSSGETPYGDGQNPLYWFGTVRNGSPINHLSTNRVPSPREPSVRYHKGYFGEDHTTASGQSNIAFFDIPRRPVESIGQYQHAMLSWKSDQPAYPLGNSLANPHDPRSGVIAWYRQNGQPEKYMDNSWMLNDNLWDDYFLSTIDPYVNDGGGSLRLRPQRDRFIERDTSVEYNRGDAADPTGLVDFTEAAGNLFLKGAFNVNSTSVEAWKTLLTTLSNDGIPTYDPDTMVASTTNSLDRPFYRNTLPLGDKDEPWTGGPRDLTDDDIEILAELMVAEVKKRGPFLSLGDFVNRRLGSDADERTLMGAVQTALVNLENASGASFANNIVPDSGEVTFPVDPDRQPRYWNENTPDFVKQNPLAFAPGDLTQADVLTSIGPLLTARSDTFVIRSFGTVGDASTSNVQARAWVELLVQRVPEAVGADPLDPYTTGAYGREFKIVGTRYLDVNDL